MSAPASRWVAWLRCSTAAPAALAQNRYAPGTKPTSTGAPSTPSQSLAWVMSSWPNCDKRTFTGLLNCWRTEPADSADEASVRPGSGSTTCTSTAAPPSRLRNSATADPTAPPPITTTRMPASPYLHRQPSTGRLCVRVLLGGGCEATLGAGLSRARRSGAAPARGRPAASRGRSARCAASGARRIGRSPSRPPGRCRAPGHARRGP